MSSRDLALVATFTGIIAALGLVPAFQPPGLGVPITAQSLGVMLAGSILGARQGALVLVTFLVLVAVGMPLLAGGRGGLGVFVGPSAGFLVGYPIAAFTIGCLVQRGGTRYRLPWGVAANMVGGIMVMYGCGIAGLVASTGLTWAAATISTWIFLPGDLAKAVLAAVIARGVHAGYPGLIANQHSLQPTREDDAQAR